MVEPPRGAPAGSIFRTEFKAELKDLFRQLARIAITLGWLRLEEVAFVGVRTQKNTLSGDIRPLRRLSNEN